MRILMDEEGLSWDDAWSIINRTFAYTNHTILSEALEKWPMSMVDSLLPETRSDNPRDRQTSEDSLK